MFNYFWLKLIFINKINKYYETFYCEKNINKKLAKKE